MFKPLKKWTLWFEANGVAWRAVDSNPKAVSLVGLAGAPLFRVVETLEEANDLHVKARQKSEEMQRLLCVALPIDHPMTMVTLPGEINLPKCRVYAGHAGSTFNLSGHQIECEFLKELKKEVLNVMSNGVSSKTPMCDWLVKLAGSAWPYGQPSGLSQLDSLLGLISRDTTLLGHLRARQLSFGRGCGDALLLPKEGVLLKNHRLNQRVDPADLRFIGLEAEIAMKSTARDRIHVQACDRFLTVLDNSEAGTASQIGSSRLGQLSTTPVVAEAEKPVVNGSFSTKRKSGRQVAEAAA